MKIKLRTNEVLIGLLFFNVIIFYFTYSRLIEGPFIFGDETEYFQLAKEIVRYGKLISTSQYNPLYPMFISFFINKNISLSLSYELIKIFNIVAFSTMIFPVFYISLDLLKNKWMAYGMAFFVVNMPFKALSVLIWAEPLYYSLFAWCIWAYFSFANIPNTKRAIRLGILLCLLLYTKQGGLVLTISVILGVLYEIFILKRVNWKTAFLIGGILFCGYMPWIVRNAIIGQDSVLGYTETSTYLESISNINLFIRAFMYQLSYVICSLLMLFFVLFIYYVAKLKTKNIRHQSFALVVAFFVLGITMLSALHRMAGSIDGIKVTYGRYLDSVFPFVIILGISSLKNKENNWLNKYTVGVTILLAGIVFQTSPIQSVLYGYGYLNSTDLVYLNDIINGYGNVMWDSNQDIGVYMSLILSMILLFLTLLYGVLKQSYKKIYLCLLLVFMVAVGFRSEYYIYRLSCTGVPENEVAKFMIGNDIGSELVRVDSSSSYRNVISEFWFDENFDRIDIFPITDNDTGKTIGVSFGNESVGQGPNKMRYIITESMLPCKLIFKNDRYNIYQISVN